MSSSVSSSGPGKAWEPPTPEALQPELPQYEILSLLGRGGMGAVYKARQKSLKREVAIKVLPQMIDDGGMQFAERFKAEAESMARLNHPGVVAVYDAGETPGGLLYIVMEFVEGTDVSQMIRSSGKLPPEYAYSITAHVCDALAYAHANGLIHRDIKPANIMVDKDGRVKVADFGLAKITNENSGFTQTNMAVGTPDFVAPEALFPGVPLDGRADLYAVGVMLYQMLTGSIPRGAFKPASVIVPGVDARYDQIVLKAMQVDREERYSSAVELRQHLDTLLIPSETPVPSVQQPASAALPQAGMTGAQTVVAQRPSGAAVQQSRPSPQPVRGPGQAYAPPPQKSKTSLFLGIVAVAAVAVGAFVMLSGKRQEGLPEGSQPAPQASSTSTASKATVANATPSADGRINLLALVDVPRDVVAGIWTKASGELVSPNDGDNPAVIGFPVKNPPEEYDLRLRLRRKGGFLMRFYFGDGKARSAFLTDHWSGNKANSGETVPKFNGDATLSPPRSPMLFLDGQPHELLIQVRKNSLEASYDGTAVLRREYGLARLKQDQDDPNALPFGISKHSGDLTVIRAELVPVSAPAAAETKKPDPAKSVAALPAPSLPVPAPGQVIDLLSTLTPEVVAKTGNGWRLENGALHNPGKPFSSLPLPGNFVGVSYQVRVKLRQLNAKEVFNLDLPVGDRMVGFALDGFPVDGYYTGLQTVNNKMGKSLPGTTHGKQVKDAELHDLAVTVRPAGSEARITATLDGKPLYEWSGPVASLSVASIWKSPPGTLTLGTIADDWRVYEVKAEVLSPASSATAVTASSSLTVTKDAPFVNSLGMKFVPVPIIGGPTDKQRVLFSVWETRVQDYRTFALATGRAWSKPTFEQTDDHPVVFVSWEDAKAFCAWLSQKEGREYRLPTDHEWSCAVGIGDREDPKVSPGDKSMKVRDILLWGSQGPAPSKEGNYLVEGYEDGYAWTAPVGSFPPSALGLHDLNGNVWEWCEDRYNPADRNLVLRGNSWKQPERRYLLSGRHGGPPTGTSDDAGFRVVVTLPATAKSTSPPALPTVAAAPAVPASSTSLPPELAALDTQFIALQKERVTAPFEADVAKLNTGYIGGIAKKIAEEKVAGHLDGILALEAEQKLLADKQPVPETDDDKTHSSLKALRVIYRDAYAKLTAARAANLKALIDPLEKRLVQMEADYTKADRVVDAKTVRGYREVLREGSAGTPARNQTTGGEAAKMVEADKSVRAPLSPAAALAMKNGITNTLGMKLVPVKGTDVLFCIHETRRQDYAVYAAEVADVDVGWKSQNIEGVLCGGEDNHPVVGVSWHDAQAFCIWLGKKEGKTYRLPTDEEWSIAVGLGSKEKRPKGTTTEMLGSKETTEFPWGGDFPPKSKDKAGNYSDTAWKASFPAQNFIDGYTDGFATTSPVMSFKPDKLGLYDMGGNIWEWVEDWKNPATQFERTLRGGCFADALRERMLSSGRHYDVPTSRNQYHGFRIVMVTR